MACLAKPEPRRKLFAWERPILVCKYRFCWRALDTEQLPEPFDLFFKRFRSNGLLGRRWRCYSTLTTQGLQLRETDRHSA